jgi:hydrogenase nickel incorporation protein HypA/HybF
MHELAVTENILNIAVQHGTQANAVRVTSLQLVIGQLSSIVDDSVRFYWDAVCGRAKALQPLTPTVC